MKKISRRTFSAAIATAFTAPLFADVPLPQDVETTEDESPKKKSSTEEADDIAPIQRPDALGQKVQKTLDVYFEKNENASRRSPWGVMHALIPYGVDAQLVASGRKVNAIGWLCWNQPCRGIRILELRNGKLSAKQGPGVQGHAGQLLAILAQSRVPEDYTIKVGGKEFTIADLIEHEKETCRSKTELTFKLIGLSHYLKSDATWKCNRGQSWDIPRLIKEEIDQPVIGAACGGTHRLMGYSYAVVTRQKQELPIEGEFKRAADYVKDYQAYTFRLQNRDGSFSTNWFSSRGSNPSLARRVQTTGHILEWMVYSIPEAQLSDEPIRRAVNYLSTVLLENQRTSWEVGPLGHALHALTIYDRRVNGTRPGHRNLRIAKEASTK